MIDIFCRKMTGDSYADTSRIAERKTSKLFLIILISWFYYFHNKYSDLDYIIFNFKHAKNDAGAKY